MQQGTPVVVSDLEIFHEVAGIAGKYFQADDAVEFAKRIEELEETSTWEKASVDSLAQAKKFNWDSSADALLKLFSEIR
jgi:glycosyltransferase involved in cell wall biosynthesis